MRHVEFIQNHPDMQVPASNSLGVFSVPACLSLSHPHLPADLTCPSVRIGSGSAGVSFDSNIWHCRPIPWGFLELEPSLLELPGPETLSSNLSPHSLPCFLCKTSLQSVPLFSNERRWRQAQRQLHKPGPASRRDRTSQIQGEPSSPPWGLPPHPHWAISRRRS